MTLTLDQLYQLLPAVYRNRDAEIAARTGGMLDPAQVAELAALQAIGTPSPADAQRLSDLLDMQTRGPLKALVAVIASQIEVLEESLYQAYDDQFIETCQEWVVPYIGDLVATGNLTVFPNATFTQRSWVADTLAFRRRKGTVSVLEHLARAVTGWDANVVEFFQLLATTQYMNHIRLQNQSMACVRTMASLPLANPYDPLAHTVDVRAIESLRGKYNIPNVGIFLWRIPSNLLENVPAYSLDAYRWRFDPLGRDIPLYTAPATEEAITDRASRLDLPMPITRRIMYDNLSSYYGPTGSVLVQTQPPMSPQPPIAVCDLTGWVNMPTTAIAIDPVLGRLAFPSSQAAPTNVLVTFSYGFSASIGGGQYSRPYAGTPTIVVRVPDDVATVQAALTSAASQLATESPGTAALVEITDNSTYYESPTVNVPAGMSITLRAADGGRPVLALAADFQVTGGASSSFTLDGLALSGATVVVPAPTAIAELQVTHCTLVPTDTPVMGPVPAQLAMPRIWVAAEGVTIAIDHCIMGSLRVNETCTVTIADSIVDALANTEVAYAALDSVSGGGPLTVTNSTVIGTVHAVLINLISDSIFTAPVQADQTQQGCARFSAILAGSRVPRQFECVATTPAFTSLTFGDPGYAQLAEQSDTTITQGADDGAEMGVFHDLYQPQREANLSASLQEYLPAELHAGIFHAS